MYIFLRSGHNGFPGGDFEMARRLKLTEEDAKKLAKDGIESAKKYGLPLKNKKKK